MSDEIVKQWLALMKKPTLRVVPSLPATASSSAAPTGRDDIVDLTLEDDEGNRREELPVAEATTIAPAPLEEQGPTTSLSPIIEGRSSADHKGKGVKRTESSSTLRDDLKRQKVNAPRFDLYVDKSVDRFVASGPSNDDMRAFLDAHDGMHPAAKRFMDAMDPEDLSKEAMRAMVLVSVLFGSFVICCSMANVLDFSSLGA